ncbi:MAG TPA: MFS transporter [Thermotogota bacterium]|nr:MFS transporter [Thermotogota bacterium]HPB86437.1 MFS transporter [Thermotogota bacterium]HQC38204.1 MFS transporter [Thermotogota bacterium]HQQ64979.1 MFS transporter [Thermotogota bacterium]
MRIKNFRYFWTGHMVSLIGTWMQTSAQSWLVLEITDSPLLLGLLGVAQFTPVLLFSLVAGVFVDRFPKRRLLLYTQTISMGLAFVLAILIFSGQVAYWQVFIVSLSLGIIKTIDIPARQSFMTELVGKENLLNAIALNSTVFNLARIVGPVLSGVMMGWVGAGWCFFINGVTFLAVLAGLWKIKVPDKMIQNKRRNWVPDMLAGLRYVFRNRELTQTIALLAIVSVFAMNYSVLVPVLAKNQLNLDASGYGFLMASLGVGSVIGALSLASNSRKGIRKGFMRILPVLTAVLFIITGFVKQFWLAMVLVAGIGMSNISFTTTANSSMQVQSDDEYRGRVMSIYALVYTGSSPIGNTFVGWISDAYTVSSAFILSGCITLALMFFLTLILRTRAIAGFRESTK